MEYSNKEVNKRTIWIIVAVFNSLLILVMIVDFIIKLIDYVSR